MKSMDIIFFAIPVFIFAMLVEAWWTNAHRRHQYRLNDTACCLSASILSSIVGAFGVGTISLCYITLFNDYRLTDVREFSKFNQALCWIALVILQDFAYYWFHRAAHRCNVMWASHITHHSSEEYNLAVALRQSSFQQFFSWPVYLPLALLGFPPEWLGLVISINLIYQFFVHTREVERLPAWIDAVFNTPSHHRVHHGANSEYLDKNYGGMFIIWDKWFGTFAPEITEVHYGITVPLKSYNPLWANVHQYVYLLKTCTQAPSFTQGLKLWIAPPNWKPEWLKDSKDEVGMEIAENGRLS